MLIFYLLLFALIFYKARFSLKGFMINESISQQTTNSVKGIFIWLVFLSHFSGYVSYQSPIDTAGKQISVFLGQLIVACFLFYSGYGVCEAIKNKGFDYVRTIPGKRIARVLIHFDLAVLIFLAIALYLNNTISLNTFILSLIGWDSLGNSNWYIFVILFLYLITWASFTAFKTSLKVSAIATTILTFIFIAFMFFTRPSWWYDTALCYILGLWFSVYKEQFFKVVTKSNRIWCVCTIANILLFLIAKYFPDISPAKTIAVLITPLFFCMLITILLTKMTIFNKLLAFSGQYLFEIYMLQRIPMILLKELGISEYNLYIYFAACVIITLLLALIFRICTNKVDSIIFNPRLRSE